MARSSFHGDLKFSWDLFRGFRSCRVLTYSIDLATVRRHNNWSPVSALVGSGNLTRKGLDNNVEVMVEAHGRDMRQAWDTAHDVWRKAWPCADRLIEYLAGPSRVRECGILSSLDSLLAGLDPFSRCTRRVLCR